MRIAVVTGASSGMGKRFAQTLNSFSSFDEVWVIARRADRLEELSKSVPFPVKPLALDLSKPESLETYKEKLNNEKPEIGLLINASGFGRFEAVKDSDLSINLNMIDLNCKAVIAMCQLSIPYMKKSSAIINIASVAAFQPIPYINVYGATKALVLSYSRALNRELKKDGIKVMALCPFWTKTEFFDRAVVKDNSNIVKKYTAMYDTNVMVNRAWRDLKRGKDVSQYGFVARAQALLCKMLPHSIIMSIWQSQQGLK